MGKGKKASVRLNVSSNGGQWQAARIEATNDRVGACPLWFCDCQLNRDRFEPKTRLQPADWLSGPGSADRAGQTYEQWLKQHRHPSWRPTAQRSTICLVPVGSCHGCDVAALAAFTSAWFGLPVVCMPPVDVGELHEPGVRMNDFGEQIRTDSVLRHLQRHCKPMTAFCTVAITMIDLYPDPNWNFVFGLADPAAGVGCFSFARYRDVGCLADGSQPSLLWRSCQTLVHEIGHLFGVAHCRSITSAR
jgi:archaemetzincin